MGFKAVDATVISSTGPTVLIPVAKEDALKMFKASRTDTVAALTAVLPADASVTSILFYGSTASDAGTTATLTVTISNNTGVISTGVVDVKGAGAANAIVNMSALPNLEPLPLLGDLQIKVVYAETGTVSTTGGPWNFVVKYVR